MGRSGYTDEGGASMMDWLRDSVESSIDSVEKGYFDPDYLLEHEHDDDDEDVEHNLGTMGVVPESSDVRNQKLLADLEAQLNEEKEKKQKLLADMLKLETELAFQDQVIEELEMKVSEGQQQIEELKSELAEAVKMKAEIGRVRDVAVASWSVAITLGVVFICLVKMLP